VIIWVDAQLSPAIAAWISVNFSVPAVALRDLGLRDATDRAIFFAARRASAILLTKDSAFLRLLDELGAPPKVIWLTCGNTSNARLRQILANTLPQALSLLQSEQLVEINSV
jgi:predicted nuclease of predicted toxin-antitoxin system